MPAKPSSDDSTLHLPRILCLHGGGTNARIFRAQCRILTRHFSTAFRLCFAEAPFVSQPGPDVTSVYKEFGPFKRWLRSSARDHPEIDPALATEAIDASLRDAMDEDDRRGATGEWAGLLGFSQGAKMCASLLLRQQVRDSTRTRPSATDGPHWRFAVLLAGRGPLVSLDPACPKSPAIVDAGGIAMTAFPDERLLAAGTAHVLHLPTVHVHGMLDPGLEEHRKLLTQYCAEGTARVMEWEGNHRVPIKTKDVVALAGHVFDVALETGVLQRRT